MPQSGVAPASSPYQGDILLLNYRGRSGWRDSHPRPLVPQTSALLAALQPGTGDALLLSYLDLLAKDGSCTRIFTLCFRQESHLRPQGSEPCALVC